MSSKGSSDARQAARKMADQTSIGIKWFLETLQERRRQLLANLARTKDEVREPEKLPADLGDLSAQTLDRESVFAEVDSGLRLLRLIEAALVRIHQGTFGDCSECGDPIRTTRLKAIPWATRCVSCQEQYERRCEQRII